MPAGGPLAFPDPPLTDGVVALRPWRRDEASRRYAAFADALTLRFSWPLARPFTPADAAVAFDRDEGERLAGRALALAVVEAADPGRVLGTASLSDVDRDERRAAVGYWLAAEARGRGAATRALRLLAGWAFAGLGVERLELTCAPDNEASQRVADRCGFVREGVLRSHMRWQGGRRDTAVFGLLPGELR